MAVESKSLLHQEVTRTIEPVLTLAAEALKLERALTDLVIEGSLSSPYYSHPERRVRGPGLQGLAGKRCRPRALTRRGDSHSIRV
jgi:hypothetical protein